MTFQDGFYITESGKMIPESEAIENLPVMEDSFDGKTENKEV